MILLIKDSIAWLDITNDDLHWIKQSGDSVDLDIEYLLLNPEVEVFHTNNEVEMLNLTDRVGSEDSKSIADYMINYNITLSCFCKHCHHVVDVNDCEDTDIYSPNSQQLICNDCLQLQMEAEL